MVSVSALSTSCCGLQEGTAARGKAACKGGNIRNGKQRLAGAASDHQRPQKTGRKKHKESRVLSSLKEEIYAKSNPQAGTRSKDSGCNLQVRCPGFPAYFGSKEFQDGCCMIGIIMLRRKMRSSDHFPKRGPSESTASFLRQVKVPSIVCSLASCFYICFFISLS